MPIPAKKKRMYKKVTAMLDDRSLWSILEIESGHNEGAIARQAVLLLQRFLNRNKRPPHGYQGTTAAWCTQCVVLDYLISLDIISEEEGLEFTEMTINEDNPHWAERFGMWDMAVVEK